MEEEVDFDFECHDEDGEQVCQVRMKPDKINIERENE